MTELIQQILSPEITVASSTFKLLLSLVLGAMVGFERRHKGQSAGMRTFALISMGATLAMIVSIYIPHEYMGLKNGDPERIAAQVISGIGFLGAGAIIQMKGDVRGLTTAAGLWVTACIGLTVGAGMYTVSVVAAFCILFVLMILDKLEFVILKGAESKILRIKVGHIVTDTTPYKDLIKAGGAHISKEYLRYDYTNNITILNYQVRSPHNTDFVRMFSEINALGDIRSLTLTNEVNN